jgi:hypothetical protein
MGKKEKNVNEKFSIESYDGDSSDNNQKIGNILNRDVKEGHISKKGSNFTLVLKSDKKVKIGKIEFSSTVIVYF